MISILDKNPIFKAFFPSKRLCRLCGKEFEAKTNRSRTSTRKRENTECIVCHSQLSKDRVKYCVKCAKKVRRMKARKTNWIRPTWDNLLYESKHAYIRRHKPKPLFCEECHKVSPIDVANISGLYLRDINDYRWLCRKCHMKSDGRLEKFKETMFKPSKTTEEKFKNRQAYRKRVRSTTEGRAETNLRAKVRYEADRFNVGDII